MPHSPSLRAVDAPIQDMNLYRQKLADHLEYLKNGGVLQIPDYEMLMTGRELIEQCDFLEGKLDIKRSELIGATREIHRLKQEPEIAKTDARLALALQQSQVWNQQAGAQAAKTISLKTDASRLAEKIEPAQKSYETGGNESQGSKNGIGIFEAQVHRARDGEEEIEQTEAAPVVKRRKATKHTKYKQSTGWFDTDSV